MCSELVLDGIKNGIAESYRRAYGTSIRDIFMYGSYARGDFTEDSDIDFVAIVSGNRLDLQNKLKSVRHDAARMGLNYDILISPTVIPTDEFDKYKTELPYYKNIMTEGISIE